MAKLTQQSSKAWYIAFSITHILSIIASVGVIAADLIFNGVLAGLIGMLFATASGAPAVQALFIFGVLSASFFTVLTLTPTPLNLLGIAVMISPILFAPALLVTNLMIFRRLLPMMQSDDTATKLFGIGLFSTNVIASIALLSASAALTSAFFVTMPTVLLAMLPTIAFTAMLTIAVSFASLEGYAVYSNCKMKGTEHKAALHCSEEVVFEVSPKLSVLGSEKVAEIVIPAEVHREVTTTTTTTTTTFDSDSLPRTMRGSSSPEPKF